MISKRISIFITSEYINNIIMYGLETRMNGVCYSFPSLTSDRDRIDEFINMLNRNDFNPDILPELVDDFLVDLYSV